MWCKRGDIRHKETAVFRGFAGRLGGCLELDARPQGTHSIVCFIVSPRPRTTTSLGKTIADLSSGKIDV